MSCGKGFKERERQCNRPVPENGGDDCSELGELTETAECQEVECPGMNLIFFFNEVLCYSL